MKFKGQNIVCFAGEDWWMHNPHSNLHLMQSFSKENRILFVNSIGVNPISLKGGGFFWKKLLKKVSSYSRYFKKAQANIYVLTPIALPVIKSQESMIRRLNAILLYAQVSWAMKCMGMKDYIQWVCSPVVAGVVKRLQNQNCKCTVYYCVDNVAYVNGVRNEWIASGDEALHQCSDMAFYVNHQLVQERLLSNPSTFYLAHGVDYEHFAKAQFPSSVVPEDLKKVSGLIVGYMGVIRGLDLELIRNLARRRPEWNFVFIGDVFMDLTDFSGISNVYFLGKKKYEELPDYLRLFSCLSLFYKAEDVFNNYRNPKKLMEYFATGKPVLSLPNLEIKRFGSLVYLADTDEAFEACVEKAIREDRALRQERIRYASSQTWDDIAEQAAEKIAEVLQKKHT